jgi:hypothetical protein
MQVGCNSLIGKGVNSFALSIKKLKVEAAGSATFLPIQ